MRFWISRKFCLKIFVICVIFGDFFYFYFFKNFKFFIFFWRAENETPLILKKVPQSTCGNPQPCIHWTHFLRKLQADISIFTRYFLCEKIFWPAENIFPQNQKRAEIRRPLADGYSKSEFFLDPLTDFTRGGYCLELRNFCVIFPKFTPKNAIFFRKPKIQNPRFFQLSRNDQGFWNTSSQKSSAQTDFNKNFQIYQFRIFIFFVLGMHFWEEISVKNTPSPIFSSAKGWK